MTEQEMKLQRELWQKSGRIQYSEYSAYLEGKDYQASLYITEEQASAEAEKTADQFKLTAAAYPVQRQALIDGFMAAHHER